MNDNSNNKKKRNKKQKKKARSESALKVGLIEGVAKSEKRKKNEIYIHS